ncbi:MAG TPA: phosphate ABC transporter permease PstA [Chloroflexota bacterium]|nr:phosphate ABC transporter permease PstA [Chloroflexota bacterium]
MYEIALRRRVVDHLMVALCGLAAAIGVGVLGVLLIHVVVNGVSALTPALITSLPTPLGVEGGGIAHAIIGSAIIVGIACVVGIPLGVGAGVYLAEYAGPRAGALVRFTADVMTGVPSIVVGIFGFALIVTRTGAFSALAGSFSLAVIAIPIVARTTEEVFHLVPLELREASLALGIRRWRTISSVVLPTASAGVITGAMLALARMAGETAPLIFTTLGNNFWNVDPTRPTAAMTLTIFQYAIWPYAYLQRQAWAASLLLLLVILVLNVAVRLTYRSYRGS